MDHDNDGFVTFEEFNACFYDQVLELDAAGSKVETPDIGPDGIAPREMEELAEAKEGAVKQIAIPDDVVRKCKAKLQVVESFTELWSSEGTGARAKVGIWRP